MNEKKSYVAKFDFFAWKYVGTLQQKTLVIWYSPKLMKVEIKKSRGLNLLSEGIIQPSLVACSRKMEWDNQKNFLLFLLFINWSSLYFTGEFPLELAEAEREKNTDKNMCFDIIIDWQNLGDLC